VRRRSSFVPACGEAVACPLSGGVGGTSGLRSRRCSRNPGRLPAVFPKPQAARSKVSTETQTARSKVFPKLGTLAGSVPETPGCSLEGVYRNPRGRSKPNPTVFTETQTHGVHRNLYKSNSLKWISVNTAQGRASNSGPPIRSRSKRGHKKVQSTVVFLCGRAGRVRASPSSSRSLRSWRRQGPWQPRARPNARTAGSGWGRRVRARKGPPRCVPFAARRAALRGAAGEWALL
jgi:hypothetical protein